MADTEPKTDEVVEQKQEEPEVVESTETAAEPESVDADESGDTDDDTAEVDDSIQRYQFRRNRGQEADEPRYEGVVRWFRADRGNYGFISVKSEELGNPDAHVHGDNVELDAEGNIQILDEDQECSFTLLVRPPPKGDPTAETKYTAKEVKPGKKKKKEKKIVKKYKGRCVFFNADKGKKFGFIKVEPCDDYPTGVEVFVHQDSIRGIKGKAAKGLVEDQEVVCELDTKTVVDDKTGEEVQRSRAINVEPGKAPLEDPEKDIIFSGSVVRWVEKFEKDGNRQIDKSFGFIRLDKDQNREVMVHNSKIVSGNKVLSTAQKCKFRIQKRKDRMNPKMPLRESAIDVVPGDVPVKKVLTGIVRFFDKEKGFGFIQRKGNADNDYYCRTEAIIGPDKVLEEKQTVTFVAAPSNRPGKPRATEVKPGPKAVNGEVAELKPEETPFEAYLPAHTDAGAKEKSKKKSNPNLPKHLQIQQDESMTEAEKAAALKKDFNFRKRMRRKRAMAREDGDSSSSGEEKEVAPPRQQPKAPAPLPPVTQQTSSKKKKSKSPKPQQQQPEPQPKQKKQQQQQQQKAAPVQTSSKKKTPKASSSSSGDNNTQKEQPQKKQQQKKQQPQQQEQAPLQTNKKKPKRRNNKNNAASKRKAKADKQQQDEEDAIDALFEANKASREAHNASSQGLFTIVYNYILSFCKTPAPKRKLKH